mmetsp:Transcript_41233/g.95504  ORF Transcript_41233/g.95504 Transcript_41233/m.95504 type:complete len:237 (+) Transcript_41233:815-1525(+)
MKSSMAITLLSSKIESSCNCEPDSARLVGKSTDMDASISSDEFIAAACLLNVCVSCLSPPKKRAIPKTSSRFESTEPNRLTLTMWYIPARSANTETISSVTLPNVALSKPPSVSLVYIASCSVTNDRRSAKGAIETSAKKNVSPSPQPIRFDISANGVVSMRMLSFSSKSSVPIDLRRYRPQPSARTSGKPSSSTFSTSLGVTPAAIIRTCPESSSFRGIVSSSLRELDSGIVSSF